jgi:serine phosphatase RsbU (regulator of sigma subunit)
VLELRHFIHVPQLDPLIDDLVTDGPGLSLVAGLNPRLESVPSDDGFLPSGRSTVFRILMNRILHANPSMQAVAITSDRNAVRVSRRYGRRVQVWVVRPPDTYEARISTALGRRPDLLIVDRLDAEIAPLVVDAAHNGYRVLSQLDTVFRGADVCHHLCDLGVPEERLGSLAWVVTVQRLSMLCPDCKQPVLPDLDRLTHLCHRYPALEELVRSATFLDAPGCQRCDNTGRKGTVMAFDVYRAGAGAVPESLLPLSEYVLRLAARGFVSLGDVLGLDTDQLRRTYSLLAAGDRALGEANAALRRKITELEVANRVLQRRTEALVSLQGMGQALISSTDLNELSARVCRYAGELCGADRTILYLKTTDDEAEVLAVSGWSPSLVHRRLQGDLVFRTTDATTAEPASYLRCPPGAVLDPASPSLRAGLRVPLLAQDRQVGLMVVQSTQKRSFAPGEVALLQTFANQAALSIQRAGLIDQLWNKIAQLEAAQVELVQKERLERELELARQVQQSVLPRVFPQVPGYAFAARNEPARQVGGDFYDVVALDAGHVGLVIADVSDKGMPAALYMALTRSLILAEARRELSPPAVLSTVNDLLLQLGQPNMFVTVFYGVLDTGKRRLTYARAGHDRPLLLRDGEVQSLGGEGMCMGVLADARFYISEQDVSLFPGDRLVMYTDGLTDVLDPAGELYGRERFESLLLRCADRAPEDLCTAVLAELAAYRGGAEQYDDMTVLVVGVE